MAAALAAGTVAKGDAAWRGFCFSPWSLDSPSCEPSKAAVSLEPAFRKMIRGQMHCVGVFGLPFLVVVLLVPQSIHKMGGGKSGTREEWVMTRAPKAKGQNGHRFARNQRGPISALSGTGPDTSPRCSP